MEAISRSQIVSFHNMENQIKLLARMIVEKPPSNALSNTVTLRDVEEQGIRFPMFMDDEDESTQEPEESTSPRFQEPLPNTSVVEEKSWKQLKENDEERRHLMKSQGNFENVKREQSLCYEKARMIFSSTLTLINLLFSFKDLKLYLPEVKTMKGNKNRAKTTKTEPSAKIQQPTARGRLTYRHRDTVMDYVDMFGSVRRLHCTWLVPRTRASSDDVDDLDSGEWIHLKKGVDRGGCGPIGLCGNRIMLCGRVRLPSEESGWTRHRGWSQGRPSRCPGNL
ncbi:hypothetical protein M9H77_36437 [Catharanthus roseus]|uniref:Uncharacterized protein n=1 Tax=Catharanthus roseus TaxID=4058 RepID=A0ACB9ZW24_CATRO|nr:hypothetical protein M9H77_36437 [Catharanthus roseus]